MVLMCCLWCDARRKSECGLLWGVGRRIVHMGTHGMHGPWAWMDMEQGDISVIGP